MSRFGTDGTFYYDPAGTLGTSGGTTVLLSQSQMPQYPFEEFRISDKTSYRDLAGNLTSFNNYIKVGYVFRWSQLDEAMAGTLRRMFDANPAINFKSGGTNFGTFFLKDFPTITESQFELYDIELEIEEK
jgi:hypothetical protein